MSIHPGTQRLNQEDYKFKASLDLTYFKDQDPTSKNKNTQTKANQTNHIQIKRKTYTMLQS